MARKRKGMTHSAQKVSSTSMRRQTTNMPASRARLVSEVKTPFMSRACTA